MRRILTAHNMNVGIRNTRQKCQKCCYSFPCGGNKGGGTDRVADMKSRNVYGA
jgi:hypothetical protein